MNKNDIYIIGAGGFGREVKSIIAACEMNFMGFVDDDKTKSDVSFDLVMFGEKINNGSSFIVAVGSSAVRDAIVKRLPSRRNASILIHPASVFQDISSISIGVGTIICAGSIFTCDISLGDFNIINLNCTIGHDVKMGDFCSLMPSVNLSGNVTLGNGVFVGSGATILQGVTLGDGVIIGAGAVVTKDIPPHCTAVGIPAKPIKFHK